MALTKTAPTATVRFLTLDSIAAIIARADQPSLRNLHITQCYGDLSHAIAGVVGTEHANWCTFATWASKTAGRFIRMADLDEIIRGALRQSSGYAAWIKIIQEKLKDVDAGPDFGHETVLTAAQGIAADVSADIAAGNLTVFAELAPVFAAMIDALQRVKRGETDALNAVLDSLKRGSTSQGGQDLLRNAVRDYQSAMLEMDPRRKAELMLRANAQVGAHEQIRLQDYIKKAMAAPLSDAVAAIVHRHRPGSPADSDPDGRHAFLDLMFHPFMQAMEGVWLEISTHYMMTLQLPGQTLKLGRDLPCPPGQPLFPALLESPQDTDLLRILRIYRADQGSAVHTGAQEWSNLSDRLRYILLLFRSRQQDTSLYEPPFATNVWASIERGIIPVTGV